MNGTEIALDGAIPSRSARSRYAAFGKMQVQSTRVNRLLGVGSDEERGVDSSDFYLVKTRGRKKSETTSGHEGS